MNNKETGKNSRESLKIKLNECIDKLKFISNDAHFAESLINDLISAQKQLDIEPTLVHVPTKDIIKEYDYGHFKIIDTKGGIVFISTGFCQVVRPVQQSLYNQLKTLLILKDKYETYDEEQKETYNDVFFRTTLIILNPLICFSDDDYWMEQSKCLAEKQNALFEKLMDKPLQDEDMVADDEFMEKVKVVEELKEEAKKLGTDGKQQTAE